MLDGDHSIYCDAGGPEVLTERAPYQDLRHILVRIECRAGHAHEADMQCQRKPAKGTKRRALTNARSLGENVKNGASSNSLRSRGIRRIPR